jgi:hypothetical protein
MNTIKIIWFILYLLVCGMAIGIPIGHYMNQPKPLSQMEKRDIVIEWMKLGSNRYVYCNLPMDSSTTKGETK